MNTIILKVITLCAYMIMVGVNYLAIALPLAGRDTGAISDSYPNLFAPAGYTFSIWGVIYALLGIYVFYQFFRNKDVVVAQVNKVFIINAFLNVSWIFAWHYNLIGLSVIIMIGLLYTLLSITHLIQSDVLNKKIAWVVWMPFSVYFGWITVATIANITTFLVSLGWSGFGLPDSFWTVLVLFVGAGVGIYRLLHDNAIPYGLVLIWAYGGILSKHLSEKGFERAYPNIISTAVACIVLFMGTILFISFKKKKE